MAPVVHDHAPEYVYVGALLYRELVEAAEAELGDEKGIYLADFRLLEVHIYVRVLKAKREN